MHNRMLQNLQQEASSGVSAARRVWEAVQSDTSTRSEQRGLLEDGGRWRKMAHLVDIETMRATITMQQQYDIFRGQRGAESMAGSAERCAYAL